MLESSVYRLTRRVLPNTAMKAPLINPVHVVSTCSSLLTARMCLRQPAQAFLRSVLTLEHGSTAPLGAAADALCAWYR